MKHKSRIISEFIKQAKTIDDVINGDIIVEKLDIGLNIGDDLYEMYVVNGDEYTVTKNGNIIYNTSDSIGTYAIAEMFIAAIKSWIEIESSRENAEEHVKEILNDVLVPFIKNEDETKIRQV